MAIAPSVEANIRCEFLGWDRPILHSACEYLENRYLQDGIWDMDAVVVVLPSSLAGRRLGELLAERAQHLSCVLRPPEIVTVGKLPEQFYQARFPFASDLVQVLCWAKVLRETPAEQLQPLLMDVPSRDNIKPWIDLARMLSGLHRELATDLMLFTDVANLLADTREEPRWRVLQKIQRKYLDELDRLHLWDIQTARRVAIDRGEPTADRDIIVLGAVDMNRAQRRFMDAVADRVTALVGAPESWSQGFDPHGALIPEFWENLKVTIDPEILFVRSTVQDAASEVARQLAYLPKETQTQHVVVGVPDPELIPILTEQLDRVQVKARFGPGVPIKQSSPLKLLEAIRDYLVDGDFPSFAMLIRTPIVARVLRNMNALPKDYLQFIDRYYHETLIPSINIALWPDVKGRAEFRMMMDGLNTWLAPLRGDRKSLTEWSKALESMLQMAYSELVVNADIEEEKTLLDSCEQLYIAVCDLADVPEILRVDATLSEAIAWVQNLLEKERISPLTNPAAVEMLGWLELALDDTPNLILTGIHDGVVPESVNADAFLPNSLRKELGLMDNSRRYARDCYVFQTILHSRKNLSVVLNQQSIDGSPLTPSRLLLAVPPEQLGERVLYLLHNSNEELPDIQRRWPSQREQSQIPIPLPERDRAPNGISVTEFRRYIECPYRYYLTHVERLQSIDDSSNELGPDGFGNLLHDCLKDLIHVSHESLCNPDTLSQWLFDQLDHIVKERFGVSIASPVQIQIEQARQRLKAFAFEQAARSKDGWTIFATEKAISREDGVMLKAGDIEIPIYGRIDRIDYHPQRNEWAVWDYKTGDADRDPLYAHVSKQGWSDLQLPLYRKLVQSIPEINNALSVSLGYINLPKSITKTGFVVAKFSEDHFRQADILANQIAENIFNGVFLPVNTQLRADWDIYSAICQSSVARRWTAEVVGPPTYIEEQHKDPSEEEVELIEENAARRKRTRDVDQVPTAINLTRCVLKGKVPPDWFDPLLIRASAGTGKTYQLAMRMLKLLFAEQPLDHVLATTFTRKAAGEILHRVMERLAKAACNDADLKALKEALQPVAITRKHCEYQLARLCSQLHRFRVSTLDAFYLQLAKSFSLELELPTGWNLADPFLESQLQDLAISRMFETQDRTRLKTLVSMLHKGDLGRSVRAEIRRVVSEGYKYFRVTDQEAWKGFPIPAGPSEEKLKDAIRQLDTYPFEKANTKKARDKLVGYIAEGNWEKVVADTIVKNSYNDVPKYGHEELGLEAVDLLQTICKAAAHEELKLRKFQLEASHELLVAYHEQLEWVKQQARAVTFDDISLRLSKWLDKVERTSKEDRSKEPGGAIAEYRASIDFRLDARVDHLLLDEFQDTSPVQWNIVRPFAEAISREQLRRSTSFFCVGDTKQAIYGWRGGVAQIFDSVGMHLSGIKESTMEKSRRSSPVIMDFVNTIFKNLERHPEEKYGDGCEMIPEWQIRFPVHSTTRDDLDGFVMLMNGPKSNKRGQGEDGDEDAPADEELMACAAEDIARLSKAAPNKSIGVLVRKNVDVAMMIHLLREHHVDASQEGGNPLTDSAAVELVLSLLEMSDHPGSTVASFHVHRSPLMDCLAWNPRTETEKLSEVIRSQVANLGFGKTISYYTDQLAPACTLRDQQRLEQLIQLGFKYDTGVARRIRDFVEFVRRERVALPHPSQVRVMTIHQSKGLEFDAVFIPDLDQRILGMTPQFIARYRDRAEQPIGIARFVNEHLRRHINKDWQEAFLDHAKQQLAESLCVFYVALTRARQALYLYASPHSGAHGEWGSVLHSILVEDATLRNAEKQVIYTSGKEEWYRNRKTDKERAMAAQMTFDFDAMAKKEKPKKIRIQLHATKPDELTRLRPTTKPSAAGEGRIVALSKVMQNTTSVGAIIGTLVHRWFEEINWLEGFQWDRNRMRDLGLKTLTPEEMAHVKIEEWLDQMEAYLELSSVKEGLTRERYRAWSSVGVDRLVVTNERRLLEIFEGTLLRGTIDRLVLGYRGDEVVRAEVLDYKTDRLDDSVSLNDWVKDRVEHHRVQLELYRRVLCEQFRLEPAQISLALILLSGDVLAEI